MNSEVVTPRFHRLTFDEMTNEQREVANTILNGPRKSMDGPFNALLRSPDLANRFQSIGAYVRFNSPLPPDVRELLILLVARHWTAHFEWFAHRQIALDVGLDESICDAIALNKRPLGMSPAQEVAYSFASSLLTAGRVDDNMFARAVSILGEQGVVDVVGAIGYYTTVSFFLNVDCYPVPPHPNPLPSLA